MIELFQHQRAGTTRRNNRCRMESGNEKGTKRVNGQRTESGNAKSELRRDAFTEAMARLEERTARVGVIGIALVNELKILYDRMDINVWEVIETAKTKPFGFQAFYPGPGLGGHCIPIDPFYLTWAARKYGFYTRFIELAGEINTTMPAYVLERIADALNERSKAIRGSKIILLGMAYKKDVDDCRESPGLELLTLLLRRGAAVHYNDLFIPRLPPSRRHPILEMTSQELTSECLRTGDCVVIVTDHSTYDWDQIVRHAPLVVDTRNATRDVRDKEGRVIRASAKAEKPLERR